jgi:hypothetical protein
MRNEIQQQTQGTQRTGISKEFSNSTQLGVGVMRNRNEK